MNVMIRILSGCIVVTLLAGAALAAGTPDKPNVLFIAIDDMNDWVGCLDGYPGTRTPNIDRLAQRGVLFTNAHCAAPVCNPSRTALLTGWSQRQATDIATREGLAVVSDTGPAELTARYLIGTDGQPDGMTMIDRAFTKAEARYIPNGPGTTADMAHPTRTGDLVVFAYPPYQFDAETPGTLVARSAFFGQHGYVPDIISLQDLGQLANEGSFLVQLRAAYQGHAAFEEVLLDGGIGKCGAITGHQETCPFEVRRIALHQPHLNRPAAELA